MRGGFPRAERTGNAAKRGVQWLHVELTEVLSDILSGVDGALGTALGGLDGLLVEQVAAENKLDLAAIVAEQANILRHARGAYSSTLSAGAVSEVLVTAETMLGYTRSVTPEFFLTLVMEPKGNLGKARLLAGQSVRRIREIIG